MSGNVPGPEQHNPIEHTQEVYGLRPEAVDFPLMSVISFVYVCNAQCPSCPYTNSTIRESYRDRPFMQADTFKIIARQCGAHQAWIRISGGGEPLLHPQALELITYAKELGAKIGLITNGSRCDPEVARALLAAQVDMLEFSVDAADAATYSQVRKGLDWERLVMNVKETVALRNKLKSSSKIIASAVNQVGVDIDEVARFWQPLVDNFQKRKYLTWGINDPARSADPAPYLPPENLIPCPFIFERLNIDARGKVMVCGFDIAATTDLGNIHEQAIAEIWHGPGFEHFRKLHLAGKGRELSLCKDCPDWQYRSWQHNYWKVVKGAEEQVKERYQQINIHDEEGAISESSKNA